MGGHHKPLIRANRNILQTHRRIHWMCIMLPYLPPFLVLITGSNGIILVIKGCGWLWQTRINLNVSLYLRMFPRIGLNSSARECPPFLWEDHCPEHSAITPECGRIWSYQRNREKHLKKDVRPHLSRHERVELLTSKTRSKSSIVQINMFRS